MSVGKKEKWSCRERSKTNESFSNVLRYAHNKFTVFEENVLGNGTGSELILCKLNLKAYIHVPLNNVCQGYDPILEFINQCTYQ